MQRACADAGDARQERQTDGMSFFTSPWFAFTVLSGIVVLALAESRRPWRWTLSQLWQQLRFWARGKCIDLKWWLMRGWRRGLPWVLAGFAFIGAMAFVLEVLA